MFHNPLERLDELNSNTQAARDPFGRLGPDDDAPDIEIADIKNPATLQAPVGDIGQNRRRDVAKTEQLLSKAGALDLKITDGLTGYWGARASDATKAFQKQNGLKIDGQINPGGETIRALGKLAGQANKSVTQSKTQQSAPHHPRGGGDPVTQQSALLNEEAVGENARAARYLASRNGIGDFSKFVAEGIETDGEKAIAETVDLYHQTVKINQDQADALIKKVIPNLNPDNAKRLQSAIMPGEHDHIDKVLGHDAPRMDEKGNLVDADGLRISNPDADPRVQKTAAPIAAAPVIAAEMMPVA